MVIQQYYPIFIFMGMALALVAIILALSYWRAGRQGTPEKNSSYECGFNPLMKPQGMFNVRFYLVSILFIIFDVEIAFLFPWAITLEDTMWLGFGSMVLFLGILMIAFLYEWKKGGLEWD